MPSGKAVNEAGASTSRGESSTRLLNNQVLTTLSVDESLDEIREKINDAERGKNYAACLSLCSQAIKLYPEVAQLNVQRARFLVLTYQPDEANVILKKILEEDSQSSEAISTLGLVFYHQAKFEKSVELFTDALKIDKTHETAVLRMKARRFHEIMRQIPCLGVTSHYFMKEQVEFSQRLMDLLEEGLAIDVTNKEAMKIIRFHQGFGHFKNNNYQVAIEKFTEALKFDEKNLEMFMLRALCYMEVSFLDDAMIDLMESQALNNNECSLVNAEIRRLRQAICKNYVAKTNYDFLGVGRTSTDNEIALSFNSLAVLHQLNLGKSATEADKRNLIFKFRRVENAFAILSNKKYRKRYDKLLKRQEAEIECPSLRTCCVNIGKCYQCCCGATGNCIGESFKGIGSCLSKTSSGIVSCCCSEVGLQIMILWLSCCVIIVALITALILALLYWLFHLIF